MTVDFSGRLADLIDKESPVEQLASGFRFLEGPVWHREGRYLLFCDWMDHHIQRWSERDGVQVYRERSNSATGLTYEPRGGLIAAERRRSSGGDGGRRVARLLEDDRSEDLATHYQGGRLSSPNDLVCLANGDIVFTDPDGGLEHSDGTKEPREVPCNGVYRFVAADGTLHLVTGEIESPNGIVKRDGVPELLVVDRRTIRRVDLETGAVSLFSDLKHGDLHGHADGMKLDVRGNLYVSGGPEGVWVLDPEGQPLGLIEVGEQAINLAWGGDDWRTLYIVGRNALYRVGMKVEGQPLNPA